MNGTLALVGAGEYLPRMDTVDRLLLSRTPGPARVVCLPTASVPDGPEVVARWERMGVEHFTRLGAAATALHIVDRATADEAALAAQVRAANFVYLSGGKPDYLYETLRETRTYAALLAVLEQGGVVAGCSAGAMIWGAALPRFRLITPFQPAFNLLPNAVILPHFDEFGGVFAGALHAALGSRTLVGIDGYTALVAADGAYFVAGSGSVTVWNQAKVRYTDGQLVQIS
jgi:cyanophycinase